MKVVVCTKQTPSTTAVFTVNNGVVSWDDPGGKPNVVNPWDEYAIEEGIRLKENHGATDVIALAIGDEDSKEALKTALAMGCTEAMLIADDAFAGSDAVGAARVWAAALNHIGDVKIALFGKLTIDDNMGVAAMMTARKLGWTPLTFVSAIKEISADSITVERLLDDGKETVTAPLPVVISVVKEINDPRYPSFMGIRKANRAEIPVLTSADLSVDGPTGAAASKVDWSRVYTIPPREGSVQMIEADGVAEQAKVLADKLFEEKVI